MVRFVTCVSRLLAVKAWAVPAPARSKAVVTTVVTTVATTVATTVVSCFNMLNFFKLLKRTNLDSTFRMQKHDARKAETCLYCLLMHFVVK